MKDSFCIEPAQTMWTYTNHPENTLATCRLSVPPGSVVIGIDTNHVLIKHGFIDDPKQPPKFETIELLAIQLGTIAPDSVWAPRLTYLGTIRLGAQIASYAIFTQMPEHAFLNNFAIQLAKNSDPKRIGELIKQSITNQLDKEFKV